jgi:hypothetical protein
MRVVNTEHANVERWTQKLRSSDHCRIPQVSLSLEALNSLIEDGHTGMINYVCRSMTQCTYKAVYVVKNMTACWVRLSLTVSLINPQTDETVLELAYNAATAVGFGKEGGMACAPKVLGDLVESLVGAVFLDCDADLDKTWKVHSRPLTLISKPTTRNASLPL